MKLVRFSLLCICVLFWSGCGSDGVTGSYQAADEDYALPICRNTARAKEYEGPLRNPVVLIHGFLGAKLEDTRTGREIWGTFSADSFRNEGLRALALPMREGVPLTELLGDSRVGGMLDEARIRAMGMEFEIPGYERTIRIFEDGGYVSDRKPLPQGKHFYSLFVYAYDWRRDLPENAILLDRFLREKQEYLSKAYRETYGIAAPNIRFDIVGHSMGGLLGRYYMKYGTRQPGPNGELPIPNGRGAQYIDRLVQVGTPNGGYFDTFLELTGGLKLAKGAPAYPVGVIGTFHTYYQMLPNPVYTVLYADRVGGEKIDLFDFDNWVRYGWGLASPEADESLKFLLPEVKSAADRRRIALDHLKKCLIRGRAVAQALAVPDNGSLRGQVAQYLFLGDSFRTTVGAVINTKTGKIKTILYDPGDGKIAVNGARFDLRDTGGEFTPYLRSPVDFEVLFHLKGGHMGIASSSEFASNVRFLLLQTFSPNRR